MGCVQLRTGGKSSAKIEAKLCKRAVKTATTPLALQGRAEEGKGTI